MTQPSIPPSDPTGPDAAGDPGVGAAVGAGVPADRYGRPPSPARRTAAVVLAVLALGGALAWAAWVGAASGRSGVTWTDVGFEIQGDTAVAVTYDVTKDPADTAVCSLRALDRNKTAIGVARVTVGPSSARTTRRTDVVRTSAQAVTGTVRTCEIAR